MLHVPPRLRYGLPQFFALSVATRSGCLDRYTIVQYTMFSSHRFASASSIFFLSLLSSCRFAQPRTTYPDDLDLSGLEVRQVSGVVSTPDYLRRAYHSCQSSATHPGTSDSMSLSS